MVDVPNARRSSLTPLRLLIGSLVLGGGVAALGLLFGGSGAGAAEPPAPNPLGSVVSTATGAVDSATGAVGDTAHAVASAVAPVLPQPVRAAAAQTIQPVTQAVDQVTHSAPVDAAVTPVADTVDHVVAATPVAQLPVVGAVVAAPVESLTSPVATLADGTLSDVSAVLQNAVAPIASTGDQPPAGAPQRSGLPSGLEGGSASALVAASTAAVATAAVGGAFLSVFPATSGPGLLDSAAAAASAPGGAPPGGSGLPSPGAPSGSLGTASSGGASGAAASAAALAGTAFSADAAARGGRSALPAGDRLPSAPLFDHDISPD